MHTVGSRVREARLAAALSQGALAKKCKMAAGTLADLERGEAETSKKLPEISRATGYRIEYLAWGQLPRRPVENAGLDWPEVLAYRTAVALGDGAVPDEYAETHKLKFRAESLRKKGLKAGSLIVVYGRGDSMAPTILSGDAILADRSDTVRKDGRLYVVRRKGMLLAKRLRLIGAAWFLQSDNQADPMWRNPEQVDEIEDFEVIGRVRWVGGWRE